MLEVLKKNNPNIEFYYVFDTEVAFLEKVLDIDVSKTVCSGKMSSMIRC